VAGAIGSNDFSIEASVNLQKDQTRAYRKASKLQSASVSSNLIASLAKPQARRQFGQGCPNIDAPVHSP